MDESKEEEKRRKKEAKEQIKQIKQQQKENKKEINRIKEESGTSKLAPKLTIFLILLFLGILFALIKLDVGGFGSNVLGPMIGDVPYVNKILPKSAQQDILPSLAKKETTEESTEDSKKKEKTTEEPTTVAPATTEAKKETKKKDSSGEDGATATTAAPTVDPTIQMYVDTYSAMEPQTAASILQGMDGDYELVARILVNMQAENRAQILAAMNTNNATKISKIMQAIQ